MVRTSLPENSHPTRDNREAFCIFEAFAKYPVSFFSARHSQCIMLGEQTTFEEFSRKYLDLQRNQETMITKCQTVLLAIFMMALVDAAVVTAESRPNVRTEVVREGLILDLDADRGVKVVDERVASWTNQVDWKVKTFTATRDANHEKGTGHPTLKENVAAIRGHNTVIFRRHELISGNEDAFDYLVTGSGHTWFAVMSVSPQVSCLKDVNSFFGNLKNGGKYEGFWAGLKDDNTLWMGSRNGITFGRWYENNPQVLGTKLQENLYYIVAGRMGAGTGNVTIDLFINEAQPVASKPFPVNPQADSSKLVIGQERDATNHPGHESFDGELARFLIWDRPLNSQEYDKTLSWLRETYGIQESEMESK